MSDKKGGVVQLSAGEHIRMRPQMYLGSLGKSGLHRLVVGILKCFFESNSNSAQVSILNEKKQMILKFKNTSVNRLMNEHAEELLAILTEATSGHFESRDGYLFSVLFHLSSKIRLEADGKVIIERKNDSFDFNPRAVKIDEWASLTFRLDDDFFSGITVDREVLRLECEKLSALNNGVWLEYRDHSLDTAYHEEFSLINGLQDLFENTLTRFKVDDLYGYGDHVFSKKFHIKIEKPEIALELIYMISRNTATFKRTYYHSENLVNGGSHISYFEKRLSILNDQLTAKGEDIDYHSNVLNYHLMTNVITPHSLSYTGPTKERIEDPLLVEIMKEAFDQLEVQIVNYFCN